jgi:hypothetical protein
VACTYKPFYWRLLTANAFLARLQNRTTIHPTNETAPRSSGRELQEEVPTQGEALDAKNKAHDTDAMLGTLWSVAVRLIASRTPLRGQNPVR